MGKSMEMVPVQSQDLPCLPDNIWPIFVKNQFRTKITSPTTNMYPNIENKCIVITGANTGLGFEAAKQFLSVGITNLIIGVRSVTSGKDAADKLLKINRFANINVWHLEMESYSSIQDFATRCREFGKIDIAILNAGVAPLSFSTAADTGHEKAIQINHFGTALLALLLVPILKSHNSRGADAPRLTVVNSLTAHMAKFPNRYERPLLKSFDIATEWNPRERYGVSKLLAQLFVVRLANIVNPDSVTINMVDPGLVKGTGLGRETKGLLALATAGFHGIAGRSLESGAACYLDATLAHGKSSHGCFLMSCEIFPLARWYYTEGSRLVDTVWEETIQELHGFIPDDIRLSI